MPMSSLAMLVVLAALWGGSFAFMRVAVAALGAVPLAFARVTLAAAALLVFAAAQRRVPDFRAHWRGLAVVGLVNSALPFVLFCFAENSTSPRPRQPSSTPPARSSARSQRRSGSGNR
jgi:drug/metabolite transporter (DMT)-like permease